MNEKYNVLIVEDDIINSQLLTTILEKFCPHIKIVGIAHNEEQFIDSLLNLDPDILLLDIDLGEEKNTLEILNEVDNLDCEIIITTSHLDYAIKTINEYHVSGYIVKPIKPVNITNAIDTAVTKILQKRGELNKKGNNSITDKILALPTKASIEFIETENIDYLEADGKYTIFYLVDGTSRVITRNIGEYEKHLPKDLFFRVHHKYIVNLKRIKFISRLEGSYCQLFNGKSLSIAKRRVEVFRRFLNLK